MGYTTRYGRLADLASDRSQLPQNDQSEQSKLPPSRFLPHSITTNIYDLQGRLASSVHENFESNGTTVNYRESTSFDYDHTGIRVASNNRLERLRPGSATMEVMHDARTDYLVDHHNFTGYAQVLREILTDNITGGTRREVLYTLGLDVIRQWSQGGDFAQNYAAWQAYDSSEGGGESNAYLANTYRPTGYVLYMYDGFGSVRALLNVNQYTHARNGEFNVEGFADPQFVRTFTYDAYGQAIGFNPHFAGTTILSRGEQFDARIGAGYNRARYIDQSTGTWLTLDPFAGTMQDPQSLHKYVYVHGDPIGGIDPTGESQLTNVAISIGIGVSVTAISITAYLDVYRRVEKSIAVGLGGVDVTQVLYSIDANFRDEWYGLSVADRQSVVSLGGAYSLSGWDIYKLKDPKKQESLVPPGGVPRTVTVRNKVYYAHEVNYFLWGLMNGYAHRDGIANTDLQQTLDWVRAYRPIGAATYARSRHDGTISGRVGWARAGWYMAEYGILSPPEQDALFSAAPNSQAASGFWGYHVGNHGWGFEVSNHRLNLNNTSIGPI